MASTDLIMRRLQVLVDDEALKVDIEMFKSCILEDCVGFLHSRNIASFRSVREISGEQVVETSDGRWCGEGNVLCL